MVVDISTRTIGENGDAFQQLSPYVGAMLLEADLCVDKGDDAADSGSDDRHIRKISKAWLEGIRCD